MDAEPSKGESARRTRRWFQFRLRSALVLTLIVAIPCAWFGRRIERKRKERNAAEKIVRLGGVVEYDYQATKGAQPPGPEWVRSLFGENVFSEVASVKIAVEGDTPTWLALIRDRTSRDWHLDETGLEHLDDLPNLRSLTLRGNRVTDAELVHLEPLTKLETLFLTGTSVSDAGLVHLKSLTRIRTLWLSDDNVSDDGLRNLSDLTEIEFLVLSRTRISDAGVVQLKSFRRLKRLDLDGTDVTDAGLDPLKGLSEIKWLVLAGTHVTAAGVKDLQTSLPNCKIYHSWAEYNRARGNAPRGNTTPPY
jgi:hypothetical protein